MRILFTDAAQSYHNDTERNIYDVMMALHKRGYEIVVYSPRLGKLAHMLRAQKITVTHKLEELGSAPDLIHGQSHLETMTALQFFPDTPAVYFYHNTPYWIEHMPLHPRILHCFMSSGEMIGYRDQRAITAVSEFIELERFPMRSTFSAKPHRALILYEYPTADEHFNEIRTACEWHQISVDIAARLSPEDYLNYDLVFTTGRRGLEAAATGAAVIFCDSGRLGAMLTMEYFDWMRYHNFNSRILTGSVSALAVSLEILQYNRADAKKVCDKVRATASLDFAIDHITSVYNVVLEKWTQTPRDIAQENAAVAKYLHWLAQSELMRWVTR